MQARAYLRETSIPPNPRLGRFPGGQGHLYRPGVGGARLEVGARHRCRVGFPAGDHPRAISTRADVAVVGGEVDAERRGFANGPSTWGRTPYRRRT
ncbi:hypothetical protein [Halohasta litchfieldiae]|uniref:hypothetical protein n=1 Tax=Halohasta litchfieldiae TaxID=1073996 RepID=UPI00115FFE47|nr:hypothetical protein [Halohasta litchfieldiae]